VLLPWSISWIGVEPIAPCTPDPGFASPEQMFDAASQPPLRGLGQQVGLPWLSRSGHDGEDR